MKSDFPLSRILKRHQERHKDIQIQYGTMDWMDSEDTLSLKRNEKWEDLSIVIVSDADHQITFQNPDEVSELMIAFYKQSLENEKKEDLIEDK